MRCVHFSSYAGWCVVGDVGWGDVGSGEVGGGAHLGGARLC